MKLPFLNRFSHEFRRDAVALAKMLLPPAFIVVMGIAFREFVMRAIMANEVINIGIIVTASYGVALIVMRLLEAQSDFRIIERFGQEAASGVPMDKLLGEPWLQRKYVRHYLAHIAQTGGTISSQLDQNAIENELHALSGEYDSKLELPQFLVGFMIAMGLLGTFIGLLTTLTGVAGMLDELGGGGSDMAAQFQKLVTDLRTPLAGMGIAFSASMFGLIFSLMLSLMITNLRRYINRMLALARNVMHDLVHLSRPAVVVASAHGDDRRSGRSDGGELVLVASRLDLLIKKIELLMQTIEVSATSTQKLNDLLGFGPRMKEISERTLEEIKAIGLSNVEQQQLAHKLIDVNGETSRMLSSLLDIERQSKDAGDKRLEALKGLATGQTTQARLAQKLIETCSEVARLAAGIAETQRLTKETGEKTVEGLRVVFDGQSEHSRLLQKLIDLNGDIIERAENLLEVARQQGAAEEAALGELKSLTVISAEHRQLEQMAVEGLGHLTRTADNTFAIHKTSSGESIVTLRNIEDRIGRVEEAEIGGARHLFAIKENLIKLCQSIGVVDLVSTGIGQQTMLLESLVEEAKVSRGALFAIQQAFQQGGSQENDEQTDGHE